MTSKKLFISYARKDGGALASRLDSDLQASGYTVWLDTSEIEGGANWPTKIERAIDECDVVLALLSTGSYESETCRAEQQRARRKNKRVIPLLVHIGADIPLHLEQANYFDFSNLERYDDVFKDLLDDIAEEKDTQNHLYTHVTNELSADGPIPYEQPQDSADHPSSGERAEREQNIPFGNSTSAPSDNGSSSIQTPFLDQLLSITQRSSSLLYFHEWDSLPELHSDIVFQLDSNREDFIQAFGSLSPINGITGIRLMGKPGFGKTRLALETIRQSELQSQTIYAKSPASIPSNLFNCLALTDIELIILVVDDCSYSDTRRLVQEMASCQNKIRLIIIEDYRENTPAENVLPIHHLTALPNDDRRKVVQQIYDLYNTSTFNDLVI